MNGVSLRLSKTPESWERQLVALVMFREECHERGRAISDLPLSRGALCSLLNDALAGQR